VLVGDSTVTDGAGWGLGFRRLVAAGVRVTNTAQNGAARRASATFPAK
jgi:pectinesterase